MDSFSVSKIFYALSEPTRREILELLSDKGQLSATDIYGEFSMSHPAVSQHLKVLRETDLVRVEKKAQQRLYKVNPERISELDNWLKQFQTHWEKSFDKLDKLLATEKDK